MKKQFLDFRFWGLIGVLITCSKGQDVSDAARLMLKTVIDKQLELFSKFEELKLEVLSMKESLIFVKGTVASVSETLLSVNGTVASVQENVDSVRDNVASVEGIIATLKGNVDSLIEKDGELRLEISDIKETVASVNQNTKSVKETVADMEETMASVQENTVIVKETVASINESTNSLLATINDLNIELPSVASVEMRVGSQEEAVNSLQGTEYSLGRTEASVELAVVIMENSTATPMAPEESDCEPPFERVGEICLYFATVGEMNHQEARQYCQSAKGDLATISTPKQFKAMIDYIYATDLTGRRFWVDGTDEDTEGIWVSSTGSLVPMKTPFWAGYAKSQEPNGKISENCLQLNPNGGYYLNDCPCNIEQNAVCEIPKTFPSPSSSASQLHEAIECPTFYINVVGKCLAFLTWLDEPWEQAQQSCTGYHGQLATVADVELFRAVYLYLHQKGMSEHSLWLGGSDGDREGSWVWLDGSPVSMGTPFWGMGVRAQEPDGGSGENCLAMPAKGFHYFRDVSCTSTFSPLCEYVK